MARSRPTRAAVGGGPRRRGGGALGGPSGPAGGPPGPPGRRGGGALQAGEADLGEPFELDEVPARTAGREVRRGALDGVRVQLTVDERGGAITEMAHSPVSPPDTAGACSLASRSMLPPASGRRCARARRSAARPRWMRERTVPSLTSSVAAISS